MKKRILILGSGESGVGAAILARQLGYEVFVSDGGSIKPVYKQELEQWGIPYEENKHDFKKILKYRLAVKSPGIPESAFVMQSIREKNIRVMGEIEFAFRHVGKCHIIAITGSNGKTTTTHLTHHLLHYAGLNARMCGNVGHSFARLVAEDLQTGRVNDPSRIFVLEVSSFQLDDIERFRPNISILLNVTPDHLDRYDYKMANYVRTKFRLVMNQRRGDLFITNADDVNINGYLNEHPEWVRCKMQKVRKADLKNAYVRIGRNNAFDISASALKGPHNMFNAACAIRTALHLGVDPEQIEEGLYYFTPPAHRMEKVAEHRDILWINDSKATNVDSVFYALQSMDRPMVWIVGGQDKGNDYAPLLPLVRKRVKAIVCLGADNSKILEVFKSLKKPMLETRSAEEAVAAAAAVADPGDAVLLSPACASFDLFKNYEHRGDAFKQAVLIWVKQDDITDNDNN